MGELGEIKGWMVLNKGQRRNCARMIKVYVLKCLGRLVTIIQIIPTRPLAYVTALEVLLDSRFALLVLVEWLHYGQAYGMSYITCDVLCESECIIDFRSIDLNI